MTVLYSYNLICKKYTSDLSVYQKKLLGVLFEKTKLALDFENFSEIFVLSKEKRDIILIL